MGTEFEDMRKMSILERKPRFGKVCNGCGSSFKVYKSEVQKDEFIEVKGWVNILHEEKMSALRNHWGVKLTLLDGKGLQKIGILDERYRVIAKERQVL